MKRMHVDDYIDFGSDDNPAEENENYARWVLNYFRGSALCQEAFKPFMKDHLLFCDYKGKTFRITGASRLGDIWIVKDLNRETGYDMRVDISECLNLRSKPENNNEQKRSETTT